MQHSRLGDWAQPPLLESHATERLHASLVDPDRAQAIVDAVEPTSGDHDAWAQDAAGATYPAQVRVGIDTPALGGGREVCGVGPSGALLVRPDQHVAWRATGRESAGGLENAIGTITGAAAPLGGGRTGARPCAATRSASSNGTTSIPRPGASALRR